MNLSIILDFVIRIICITFLLIFIPYTSYSHIKMRLEELKNGVSLKKLRREIVIFQLILYISTPAFMVFILFSSPALAWNGETKALEALSIVYASLFSYIFTINVKKAKKASFGGYSEYFLPIKIINLFLILMGTMLASFDPEKEIKLLKNSSFIMRWLIVYRGIFQIHTFGVVLFLIFGLFILNSGNILEDLDDIYGSGTQKEKKT